MENQGYRPYYQPYQPQPPANPAGEQFRRERKNLFRIGLGLLVYMLLTFALQGASVYLCSRFFPSFYYNNDYFSVLVSLASYVVGLPVFYAIVGSMPRLRPERKKLGGGNWVGFLAISFFLMWLGSMITSFLMPIMETLQGKEISNAIAEQVNSLTPLSNFLLAVVMAPIAEELICRKWIIDRLLPYSEWLAVVTSGLLFGLIHGNFYQFFYAALIGILFGVVYVKTGKLIHTILMHAIINFSETILLPFINEALPQGLEATANFNPWAPVILLYFLARYALIVCGIIFLVRYLKRGRLSTAGVLNLPLGVQIKATWLNWGTVLAVCYCLVQFGFSLFI